MKILLTGGRGLLGRHFIEQVKSKHETFSLVRERACQDSAENPGELVVNLAEDWNPSMLPGQVDTIIHLAQSPKFREFPQQAMDVFKVNIATPAKLLDYAVRSGARKIILASSGGVYGKGEEAFKEKRQIVATNSMGYYLGSKLCSEILAESYANELEIIILRFFFLYGPGQKRDMLIPRLIDSVRSKKPITLHDDDGIKINPTHVSDAVSALKECLNLHGNHKINIAGPEVLSLRRISEIIGQAVGEEPVFKIDESVKLNSLIGDIHKMKEYLITPRVHFEDGIKTML